MNYLDALQARSHVWVQANFPDRELLDAALISAEEAAEAAAAMNRVLVKERQEQRQEEGLEAKMRAEFADVVIAFADYCTLRGWKLSEVVEERAVEVFARVW